MSSQQTNEEYNLGELSPKNVPESQQPTTTKRKSKLMENPLIRNMVVLLVLTFVHSITSGYVVLLRVYGLSGSLDPIPIIVCRNLFGVMSSPVLARITEGPLNMPDIQK